MTNESDYEDYPWGEGELSEEAKMLAFVIGVSIPFGFHLIYCLIMPV